MTEGLSIANRQREKQINSRLDNFLKEELQGDNSYLRKQSKFS